MSSSFPWIISAAEAQTLLQQGATVLDVRPRLFWFLNHVPQAVQVRWQSFAQPHKPDRGKLLDDPDQLTRKLQDLGIWRDRPVVVVGWPPQGWGEDGRMVWMLRTLGHPQAALVDGGHQALVRTGMKTIWGWVRPQPGDFRVQRTSEWDIQRDELKTALTHGAIALLDTREPREYEGATPYGEQRGGHLPGAMALYFKAVLDPQGYLLPIPTLQAMLQERGIQPESAIAAYCKGGVRAAFIVTVLQHIGYTRAKNYAGSTWEWAASPPDSYPLTSDLINQPKNFAERP